MNFCNPCSKTFLLFIYLISKFGSSVEDILQSVFLLLQDDYRCYNICHPVLLAWVVMGSVNFPQTFHQSVSFGNNAKPYSVNITFYFAYIVASCPLLNGMPLHQTVSLTWTIPFKLTNTAKIFRVDNLKFYQRHNSVCCDLPCSYRLLDEILYILNDLD